MLAKWVVQDKHCNVKWRNVL